MVGKQTGRIARGIALGALSSLSLLAPAAVHADELYVPDAEVRCPSKSVLGDHHTSRKQPLVLPKDWTYIASSSMNWIAVMTQMQAVHCVETAWFEVADNYQRFDNRFLGFSWRGYEAGGYILIDSVGTGQSMDIGTKPSFSPDKTFFAVVQFSEAGWGGFEGFAVWRIYPGGITPMRVETTIPNLADWRIDRWEGEDCLHLSAIPHDRITDWNDLSQYRRDSYVAAPAGGWALTPGDICPTS